MLIQRTKLTYSLRAAISTRATPKSIQPGSRKCLAISTSVLYHAIYPSPEYLCLEWVRFDVFFRTCRNLCSTHKPLSVDEDRSLTILKAFVHLKPKRIAIRDGYFGVHNTLQVYRKINPTVVSGKRLKLGWIGSHRTY